MLIECGLSAAHSLCVWAGHGNGNGNGGRGNGAGTAALVLPRKALAVIA